MSASGRTKVRASGFVGFRASGPVLEMIAYEMRGGRSRSRVLVDCVLAALGGKYPKQATKVAEQQRRVWEGMVS